MNTLIPIKSPHLLSRAIDAEHFYAVNCSHPNSLRLLNRAQHEILSAIDNRTSIAELSERFAIPDDMLEDFLALLSRTEIIRFDAAFTSPRKPDNAQSLNFWVHTTNRCNLGCGYCYISTLNATGGMAEYTRQQLLRKLVQTVQNRQITHIRLRLAGGEPLTQFRSWKDFIPQAKETLRELGCTLDFSFLTNLTILTDEMIAFSKQYRISYGVSLDGLADHHDASRTFKSGAGSFAVVSANLHRLIAHDIPVSINTVVNDHNLAGLPALTRYLVDLDVPFRYSIVKGEPIGATLLEQALIQSYEIMGDAIQRGWRFSNRHQFCDLKPNELGFQTCASGFSGGAIYVDGSVNYCHVHFGDDNQLSFSLTDNDLDLADMIEQGLHYEDMNSPDCKSCPYKYICTSGCPVYRVNGKDPQCATYHKFIPLIYDLQARERLKLLTDSKMMPIL
jgi:uncharacterized protein